MAHRRILSLWFPRLAAERHLRRGGIGQMLAVVQDEGGRQVLVSLSAGAEAAGLRRGQPLRDAQAACPALITRTAAPEAEAAFLSALRRWAGRFSPWVAEDAPDGLALDLTGCAHLFGGEAALMAEAEDGAADLGLTLRAGLADTRGAAWALARFAGQDQVGERSGDAIDQEARATRSRAARRRTGGDPMPSGAPGAPMPRGRIAPPHRTTEALAPLPLAALRLPVETVAALGRVGLRRVGDLAGMPRAPLARRFGPDVVRRLDQGLGADPEPVSPVRADRPFAVRLTLPDPIGLESDVAAGVARLLPRLCAHLASAGRGARRVRLQAFRTDHRVETVEVGLARPSAEPDRIEPLLGMKLAGIDAGFGIDMLRLSAPLTEPVHAVQHRGHLDAGAAAAARTLAGPGLEDLIGRIGARVGLESVTRWHPAESHIPEKAAQVLAAAWSEPAPDWPPPPRPRPLVMFRPEPVTAPERPALPDRFRWRRREMTVAGATGPERIAPEWWLDDPDWRSGVRDYWRVETEGGERLWLFYAHGGAMSGGWFCHGTFA